jgi:hypothetical protein
MLEKRIVSTPGTISREQLRQNLKLGYREEIVAEKEPQT